MVKVNYEESYKHKFGNVQEAVKFYLKLHDEDTEYGIGFILYPRALNPFLKIIETMDESKNVIILPAFNHDYNKMNDPMYLVLKVPMETDYLYSFDLCNEWKIKKEYKTKNNVERIVNSINSAIDNKLKEHKLID